MAIEIPESVRQVIEGGRHAHLVTLDPDGTPHATLAWIGIEDGEIVIGTMPEQRKLRNIRRDPRVLLSIPTDRSSEMGLLEYVVVNGTARVTEGGAPELLQRLAYTYIGPDVTFPPFPNPPPGFVIRIAPERFGGVGPWADGG